MRRDRLRRWGGLRAGALLLDPVKHLLTVDLDVPRGVDAEFDLAALLREDFDADVVSDPQRFAAPSGEYEQENLSLLGLYPSYAAAFLNGELPLGSPSPHPAKAIAG